MVQRVLVLAIVRRLGPGTSRSRGQQLLLRARSICVHKSARILSDVRFATQLSFHRTFPSETTNDLVVSIQLNERRDDEDVYIVALELHVL